MRFFITGGYGYLGSSLAFYLSNLGHEIILGTSKKLVSSMWLPSAKIINIDWDDFDKLHKICMNVDQVIHAAGINSQDCFLDPIYAMKFNCEITTDFAKLALQAGVKRFIYLSTIHVYSSNLIGTYSENSIPNNSSPYARSKFNGERGIEEVYKNSKDKFLILRLSNVIGAPIYFNKNKVELLSDFICKKIIKKENIFLENPFQFRDFITIGFLLEFLKKSLKYEFKRNILNISSGNSIMIKDFAEKFNNIAFQLYGYKVKIKYVEICDDLNSSLYIKSASPFKNISNDLNSEIKNLFNFCKEYC